MGTQRLGLAALLAAATLLVAGCGADDDEQPAAPAEPELPEADPAEPGTETAACANPEAGYAVEYPADWHANEDAPTVPCTLFHPEPFDADAVDPPAVAIQLTHDPLPYGEATAEDAGRDIVGIGEAEVAGRPATRLEFSGTGEEALPEGARGYAIVVDLGDGTTLVGSTHENGHDFERSREVLDSIMESLVFTQ
jgi:hypothetical protein